MKRFIGWLANFYPKHFFYAADFGDEFDMKVTGEMTGAHETFGTTALLATAIVAGRNMKEVGDELSAEFTCVTDAGKDIGDYRVVIEKIGVAE